MLELKDLKKNITLDEFLTKLKIPGIGKETSKKIACKVKNIQTLRNCIEEGTCGEVLEGVINSKTLSDLEEVLCDMDWILLLEDMEDAGFDMFHESYTEVFSIDDIKNMPEFEMTTYDTLPIDLKGLEICIAGTLSLPRKMFQSMVEKNGGIFKTMVSKKTDVLVYSEKDGLNSAKFDMARKLNKDGAKIYIITEKTFVEKFSKTI